nr:ATP-dependent metallopeptidase FtsH/Yme1/Tma family protein [Lachnospiraceae bacterium]
SANFLKDELFELTRQLENVKNTNIKSVHLDIEWDGMSKELKRLFENDGKTEVLVLASKAVAKCFDVPKDKYVIHHAKTLEEAKELLKYDLSAAFIDPGLGARKDKGHVLSISDYNSIGNDFFKEMIRIGTGLPVYILEVDETFSEVDRRTFIQEGAENTICLQKSKPEAFSQEFERIMEELYMEKENLSFSQKGWVIDFCTKQIVDETLGKAEIYFYDLRKTMAINMESRDTILTEAERPDVRFSDVIGAKKAKEELSYFINYLKNPKQFLVEGGKPPKGVLLYGPPGTGKTMLAKAMAGETDVNFIQISATEFMNRYVGASEENIRKLFKKARRYAPAIIFIDEIDAIGKKRTGGTETSTTESMLNTLLTEMEGFATDNKKPVFVLAATNYGVHGRDDGISALDEALVRRFDNRIYVDLPTEEERKVYIDKISKSRNLTALSDEVKTNIAERTTGQSLAIIQNVVDLAYRNAVKEQKKVTDDILLNALEEYLYGEKKERDADYYKKVAIHEVGHAYTAYIGGDKPSYITIESRGDFGGYIQHANQEDIPEYSREDLICRIRTCLAGRAAESVFYGREKSLNTGASSDLDRATDLAWKILCAYGMDADSLIVLRKEEILLSTMAQDYVSKVNDILKEEMQNTIKIIEEGKEKIKAIADILVKENYLTGAQFEELMNGGNFS